MLPGDDDPLFLFHRRDGTTFNDPEEAGRLLGDIAYRRVALTKGPGWEVSTVFLVIPHPPFEPHPCLYETMAGGEIVERYPNEVAALAGHDRWVRHAQEVLTGPRGGKI